MFKKMTIIKPSFHMNFVVIYELVMFLSAVLMSHSFLYVSVT